MYFNNTLTEKELIKDLLMSEKELASLYNDAILESPCPILRNTLSQCFSSAQNIQFLILEASDRRGWNSMHSVNERDIKGITEKFKT